MVKTLSALYLEARKALSETEDMQTAGLLARNLLCHLTDKTPEQLISDLQMYASEKTCQELDEAVARVKAIVFAEHSRVSQNIYKLLCILIAPG